MANRASIGHDPVSSSARMAVLFCACAIRLAISAELPDPQLALIFPSGGKIGETVPVAITGTDIEEGRLRFSHPGLVATADAKDPKKFNVSIASEVPPGRYDVRVVGKYGISNPRIFEVGTAPEFACNTKCFEREIAQEAAWPCVINGTTQSQRTFWFKIPLAKGRKVSIDCQASLLDSKLFPLLILFDFNGRELIRARDAAISWEAVADGAVYLALRDFMANGGPENFFRLHIKEAANAPQPPPESALVFWPSTGKAPTPETEPNDLAHPTAIVPPCELQGQFFPAGDVDSYRFEAKKGDVWWMEVLSQRLGLPTNPRLIVQLLGKDAAGVETAADVLELNDGPAVPGAPDFDGSHLDPIGKFEAKEDGTYRIALRDLNNTFNDDPRRRYTLSIRRETPDFALVAMPVPLTDNKPGLRANGPEVVVRGSNIRPGEMLPIHIVVLRRDGFKGDVSLSADGLPEGISALQTTLGGDAQETMLFLQAASADKIKAWAGSINIVGKATIDGHEIVHQARTSTPIWNVKSPDSADSARSRFAQEFTLGVVTDAAIPTAVSIDSKPVETTVGSKIKFAFQITRGGEFKDAIKLKPYGVPGLEKAKELEIPAGAIKAEYELDFAPLKLAKGTYTFWFKGQDKGKLPVKGKLEDVTINVYSGPVIVRLKDAK